MRAKPFLAVFMIAAMLMPALLPASSTAGKRPDAFVDVEKVIPDVLMDIRYYGEHNFVGARVDGYLAPKCLLTRQVAAALAGV